MSLSPDTYAWLEIAIRLVATASLVVAATWAAERSGPLIGALIATLPISAGPAYVFVALAHDAAFVGDAALSSIAINAATLAFCLAYVVAAQRWGVIVSYCCALASWLLAVLVIQSFHWSVPGAVALNIATAALGIPIARRFTHAPMARTRRRWYDIPFRAALVALFVTGVVAISAHVGPMLTGALAVFPIVLSSLIIILQPRVGGPAVAALLAHGVFGVIGFGVALLILHLAARPLGSPLALTAALAVALGWNALLLLYRRRRRAVTA